MIFTDTLVYRNSLANDGMCGGGVILIKIYYPFNRGDIKGRGYSHMISTTEVKPGLSG